MSFSERLTTLRRSRNLTQTQMSEITGIHLSQIKRYESGHTQPSLDVLRKIALALHVSADTLVFDEGERDPPHDWRFQFEALTQFTPEEQKVAKSVIDSLILKHTASQISRAS